MKKTENVLLNANARYLLGLRYLARDARGRLSETPEEMFRRAARVIAGAESLYSQKAETAAWEEKFYRLMACLEFLPNSPTLLNAGRLSGGLSSCFVLPVPDSLDGIFKALHQAALVHQGGGGTGFSFSHIRPCRDAVGRQAGRACGPVAFIAPFSAATYAVKQGGIRPGCSIVLLDVHHPDILSFIQAKDNRHVLANFYLSVGVDEPFMEAVKNKRDYDLVSPRTGKTAGALPARLVFERLVAQTWKTGDPGIVFLDRLERDNPTPRLGRLEGVSGCGEQPLLPYESCNLGSINLSRMLRMGGKVEIDWEKLGETVRMAVRFLDNVIDVNKFPLPQIEEMTRKTRKVGLGVMGFADMLIQLGIPYDSEEALKSAEEVMAFIQAEAHSASQQLAGERGTFPAFAGSVYDRPGGPRMRNASCTTIAPTGTISLLAGCSNGIEPHFAHVYVRRITGGRSLLEVNPLLVSLAREKGFYSDTLIRRLAAGESLGGIPGVPKQAARLFATAPLIASSWHVRMQAAFQRYVDNAVSKTVNLPADASQDEVAKVYMLADREGLKGTTIYRDRSRRGQPLGGTQASARLVERWLQKEEAAQATSSG